MTIWASTDGSEEGRLAFHEWSAKAKKYDQAETEKRWQHYFRSPPTRLGFGSLVYRARQADPEWRYENPAGAGLSEAVGKLIAQLLLEKDEPDDNDGAGRPQWASGGHRSGCHRAGRSVGQVRSAAPAALAVAAGDPRFRG